MFYINCFVFGSIFRESIYTNVCPGNSPVTDTERSVTMSHYQIWHSFQRIPNPRPDDLLAVFEDDAESTIHPDKFIQVLESQFKNPQADYNMLGWCLKSADNETACCTHAYFITRRGAEILTKNINLCSIQIDNQIRVLHHHYNLSVSFPRDESYLPYINYPNYSSLVTMGIFIQRKGLVSFNGHQINNS